MARRGPEKMGGREEKEGRKEGTSEKREQGRRLEENEGEGAKGKQEGSRESGER